MPFRFDSYAHVEWGSDARTGLLWLYIPEPTLGLLEERWVLMQACETYQQTRVFERPEQVNDALMRQHGVLIDVADSLQPLDEPQPLLW